MFIFADLVPDTPLAAWGPPGFIIVVLSLVVMSLYRDNKQLNKDVQTEKDKRFADMQESRDAIVEPVRKFNEVAQAILNLKTRVGHE
jgi:hypothetical protein